MYLRSTNQRSHDLGVCEEVLMCLPSRLFSFFFRFMHAKDKVLSIFSGSHTKPVRECLASRIFHSQSGNMRNRKVAFSDISVGGFRSHIVEEIYMQNVFQNLGAVSL